MILYLFNNQGFIKQTLGFAQWLLAHSINLAYSFLVYTRHSLDRSVNYAPIPSQKCTPQMYTPTKTNAQLKKKKKMCQNGFFNRRK